MARTALTHVSSALPRSVWTGTESHELSKDLARELQAENDELSETNRQLIAAMEEMQSLNVTLQSVNEALHTANIELRSEVDTYRVRLADLLHDVLRDLAQIAPIFSVFTPLAYARSNSN